MATLELPVVDWIVSRMRLYMEAGETWDSAFDLAKKDWRRERHDN